MSFITTYINILLRLNLNKDLIFQIMLYY